MMKLEDIMTNYDELRKRLEVALLKKQAEVAINIDRVDSPAEMDRIEYICRGLSEAIEVTREFFSELR